MPPRRTVTPASATIANSGQGRSKDFSRRAQQPTTKTAAHDPPPCAPKHADHHPCRASSAPPGRAHRRSTKPKLDAKHRSPRRRPPSSPPTEVDAEATLPLAVNRSSGDARPRPVSRSSPRRGAPALPAGDQLQRRPQPAVAPHQRGPPPRRQSRRITGSRRRTRARRSWHVAPLPPSHRATGQHRPGRAATHAGDHAHAGAPPSRQQSRRHRA